MAVRTPAAMPESSVPLTGGNGAPNANWYRWFQSLATSAKEAAGGVNSQAFSQSFLIQYPEDGDYKVEVNAAIARTITSVTTICTTGTATLTVKINTTALGGTANSVSTSEQTQAHTSANAIAAGDDMVLTFSSVSSAENVTVTIAGTVP